MVSGLYGIDNDRSYLVDRCEASFRWKVFHDGTLLHPLIEEKGMSTMRLQRLHLSSNPCPCTLAIS